MTKQSGKFEGARLSEGQDGNTLLPIEGIRKEVDPESTGVFSVTIPTDISLDEQIRSSFRHADEALIDAIAEGKYKQLLESPQIEARLFRGDTHLTSSEAISLIHEGGFFPATPRELVAFALQYPKKMQEAGLVVALDIPIKYDDTVRVVSIRHYGGDPRDMSIRLPSDRGNGTTWSVKDYFLGTRKKS